MRSIFGRFSATLRNPEPKQRPARMSRAVSGTRPLLGADEGNWVKATNRITRSTRLKETVRGLAYTCTDVEGESVSPKTSQVPEPFQVTSYPLPHRGQRLSRSTDNLKMTLDLQKLVALTKSTNCERVESEVVRHKSEQVRADFTLQVLNPLNLGRTGTSSFAYFPSYLFLLSQG